MMCTWTLDLAVGSAVKLKAALISSAFSVLIGASPAFAQTALAPAPLPAAATVAGYYDTYGMKPIWFRNGTESPAAAVLASILQKAPFDGFAQGPHLAAQVQAAAAQARSGNPADVTAADERSTCA